MSARLPRSWPGERDERVPLAAQEAALEAEVKRRAHHFGGENTASAHAFRRGASWQREQDAAELKSLREMKARAEAELQHYSRGKAYLERHEVVSLLKRILEGDSPASARVGRSGF